jgi:membrane-associated protease RseP (regulator of RpoE activity)
MAGMPFAMALMAILLSHEMGHYLTAKRYCINASPPYFLPAPIEFTFIGTLGAFIRLRSPVVDRRQLMDVGAAGPWVGFVVALLMLVVGLQRSYVIPPGHFDAPMVIEVARGNWLVGDSLITWGLRHFLIGDGTAVLHPLAVAGWVGMLVTALNLLPLGQLDGGHILYALFGDRQRYVGVVAWLGLVVLGRWFWPWWVWAGLTLLLGGGRLSHPRVLEPRRPLPASRIPLGWGSIALFVITFAPVPLRV